MVLIPTTVTPPAGYAHQQGHLQPPTDSPFDLVWAKLRNPQRTGRGARACCPAHEDSHPSLDVDVGSDGRVLLKCRSANCSTEDIVAALGLRMPDLFPRGQGRPVPSSQKKGRKEHATPDDATRAMCFVHGRQKGKLTRHHDYHDSSGAHVMRTMRFDYPDRPKQFGQAHRQANGTWVNAGMPAPRPLYLLPELLKADPESPVVLVEGEKCAEACASLGFVSTTTSQGARSPEKSDFSPLKGRCVIIAPDNDEAGRCYLDAVARLVEKAGASSIRVLALPDLEEHDDIVDWIDKCEVLGLERDAIRARLSEFLAAAPVHVRQQLEPPSGDGRHVITVVSGELDRTVAAAEEALLANPDVVQMYQRGALLVRVARIADPGALSTGAEGPAEVPTIINVASTYLRSQFERVATFLKVGEDNKWKTISCPADVAACYLQSAGNWRLRKLRSVTTAPTMRVDGTVIQDPGYDPKSCVLYDPCGVSFPRIADSPDLQAARASADRILELVCHFDFVDDGARSVWLAALLTSLVRSHLPSAPMFAIDAPTRGSGKSKLATIVGTIATGQPPATMSLVDDIDEVRKRVFALLLRGTPVVNIDNVDLPISGMALCSAMTERTYSDRILGASEIIGVPTTSTWIATGNNIVVRGDMDRRVLVCRLDPLCERPEERRFDFDPVAVADKNRPSLVADALTILRAHAVAGRPQSGIPPFGSFEIWSEIIRAAIVWIGMADPIAGRQAVVEDDGGIGSVAELLRAWHDAYGPREMSAREATSTAGPDLLNAIDEAIGADVAPQNRGRKLGQLLSTYRDRVVGGFKVGRRSGHAGTHRWSVSRTTPSDSGDGGNGGNGGNPAANRGPGENQVQGCAAVQTPASCQPPSSHRSHRSHHLPAAPGPSQGQLPDSGWSLGMFGNPDDGLPEQPGGRRRRAESEIEHPTGSTTSPGAATPPAAPAADPTPVTTGGSPITEPAGSPVGAGLVAQGPHHE
ncbi:MAG: hypothetical protein K8J09_15410 [Planctomycetes bacterium]|nr:hypothetical protein [Planctomycetota bacterium]